MLQPLSVKPEPRGKLPQEGTQFLFEPQDARGKKIGKRRLDFVQLLQMRDVTAALYREHKTFWRLAVPARKGIGALQRIMRAVDLDRVDLPAGISQLIGMPQPARIERPAPAAIVPAGDPDPYRPRAAHRA